MKNILKKIKYKKVNMNGHNILMGYIGGVNDIQEVTDANMREWFLEELINMEGYIQRIGYELMYYDAVGRHIPDNATLTIWEMRMSNNKNGFLNNKVFEDHLKYFFKKFVRDFSADPLDKIIKYIHKFNNKKWIGEKLKLWNDKHDSNITKDDFFYFKNFRNTLVHAKHIDLGEKIRTWDFTDEKLDSIFMRIGDFSDFLRSTSHTFPMAGKPRVSVLRTGWVRK